MADPKTISDELKDYIRKHFYCKGRHVFRDDKKKHSTGSIDHYGYVVIKVKGVKIKEHRIVWFLNHGEFPKETIDHINHDRTDNSIENLRPADALLQSRNHKKRLNKETGADGIYFDKTNGLKAHYAFHCLGKTYRYRTVEEAVKAKKAVWEADSNGRW